MGKILIIEDVAAVRELVAAVAKGLGHTVVIGATATEASKLLTTQGPFDLALLDIGLADGDGISITKLISGLRREGRCQTKVCFISGARVKDTVLRAIESGGNDYLVKPINPVLLKEKINHLLADVPKAPTTTMRKTSLKANLFESVMQVKLRVMQISAGEFLVQSDTPFNRGRTIEIAIPTLGSHIGYKGTFRGVVSSCLQQTKDKYEVTIQLSSLGMKDILNKVNALCAKDIELVDKDDIDFGVHQNPSAKSAAKSGNQPAPTTKPVMSSLLTQAMSGMNKVKS